MLIDLNPYRLVFLDEATSYLGKVIESAMKVFWNEHPEDEPHSFDKDQGQAYFAKKADDYDKSVPYQGKMVQVDANCDDVLSGWKVKGKRMLYGSNVKICFHLLRDTSHESRTHTETHCKGGIVDAINRLNNQYGYEPIVIDWIVEE